MGKAIIIPGISFASLGMGKVHLGGVISITAPNVAVGSSCQLESSSISTTWSVDSDTYATIDSNGLLTIKSGAWGNNVVVTATDANNVENTTTKTIKLYYSSISSGQFNESIEIDQSSNLRDGGWGNSANTVRVGSNTSIGINGYRYCMVKTTRPNESGYAYYIGIQLGTYTAGTQNKNSAQASNHICEMGGQSASDGGVLIGIDTLFPLFEEPTFTYYYANAKTGQTPVSFGITFDESNNGNYSGDRALRASQFSGYTTIIAMFK